MALLLRGKTQCALCHEVIGKDDEIVGTTHFIADRADPLWPFSDAVFPKRCFDAWERRGEFIARHQEARRRLGGAT